MNNQSSRCWVAADRSCESDASSSGRPGVKKMGRRMSCTSDNGSRRHPIPYTPAETNLLWMSENTDG